MYIIKIKVFNKWLAYEDGFNNKKEAEEYIKNSAKLRKMPISDVVVVVIPEEK